MTEQEINIGMKIRRRFTYDMWKVEKEFHDHYDLIKMEGFFPHRKMLMKNNISDWTSDEPVTMTQEQHFEAKILLNSIIRTPKEEGKGYGSILNFPITEWWELEFRKVGAATKILYDEESGDIRTKITVQT